MVFMVPGEHVTHRLSLCPAIDAENTRRLLGSDECSLPTGIVMDLLFWYARVLLVVCHHLRSILLFNGLMMKRYESCANSSSTEYLLGF